MTNAVGAVEGGEGGSAENVTVKLGDYRERYIDIRMRIVMRTRNSLEGGQWALHIT